ncbi:collagen alpha-3(IV) chain-like isoform X3 [Spodoptera frugiperda]|uniref:Collagen alpha-3(IV) chain-like isoform X3 n=1 Tax=Spodoptera frugiperda TaxID=7108 RepID=A0A9R0D9L6_SPOFR|nr:collagen alpha-3(IV) chain-like isoform X3 [Spodoptera frugiperda]
MDIGNNDKIGCQVLVVLALLASSLPPSAGYIDCRISCRRCHENTEHPSVLEVYCAMCEECKQRRRERYLIRMRDGVGRSAEALAKTLMLGPHAAAPPPEHIQDAGQAIPPERPAPPGRPGPLGSPSQYLQPGQPGHSGKPGHPGHPGQALLPMLMQRHPQPLPHLPQQGAVSRPAQRGYGDEMDRPMPKPSFPAGCPTPPVCPDSEEDEPEIFVNYHTDITTTTTSMAPTTPQCPAIRWCRKKKKPPQQSCMPCMPMCPCPVQPSTAGTTHQDYQYVYIGLPKGILRPS